MDKKKDLLSLLFGAAFLLIYLYLKHSGIWANFRWAGLVLGAVWAVTYFLVRKHDGGDDLGLRAAIFFAVAGIVVLAVFLIQPGDSGDGLLASMFLGFGARGLCANHKSKAAQA